MDLFLFAQLNTRGETQEIKLEDDRITIGRDPKNKIHVNETYISSRHAIIYRRKSGEFYIVDHDSRNGTFVNDVRLSGDENQTIKAGDIIKLGYLKLTVAEKGVRKGIEVVPLRDRKKVKGRNFSTA